MDRPIVTTAALRRALGARTPWWEIVTQDRPLDIRVVDPVDLFDPRPMPPRRLAWFRALGAMPDDPLLHQAVLA